MEADTAVVQGSQAMYQVGRRIWKYHPHGTYFEGINHAVLRRSWSTAKVRYCVSGLEYLWRSPWILMH